MLPVSSLSILLSDETDDIDDESTSDNKEVEKTFAYFGDGLYGEFSSVSYRTFYLINILTKTIEEIN